MATQHFNDGAYLCAAGPGVGKGRQIAALVFENLLRGRKKVGKGLLMSAQSY